MVIERFSPLNPPPHRVDATRVGDLIFVAGMTALDFDDEGRWDPHQDLGDVTQQARAALSKLDLVLAAAGSDKRHLLWANVWLEDVQDYAAFNEVWNSWLEPGTGPARACVGAVLAVAGLRVEIAVVAAVSDAAKTYTK